MTTDILIVDDNLEAAELLRELLDLQGHTQVRVATTGAQALELMRALPARILLVDQNLPDTRGSDLVPQLRALVDGPCQAIAITGAADGLAGAQGFDHVLGKPLEFDTFEALLARCIAAVQAA